MENINLTVDKLVEWLKEKVEEAKAEGLVLFLD